MEKTYSAESLLFDGPSTREPRFTFKREMLRESTRETDGDKFIKQTQSYVEYAETKKSIFKSRFAGRLFIKRWKGFKKSKEEKKKEKEQREAKRTIPYENCAKSS